MTEPSHRNWLRIAGTVGIVLLLLAGAAALSYWIQSSEPTAKREAATRRSAALVETTRIERGTHSPTISVLGAVRPAREVVLSPRVAGEIVAVDDSFRPGAVVQAGQQLLEIDPTDYEQAIVMRESEVGQVEAELAIEEGQQRVAEREFRLLGEEIGTANRSLVLREPQIASLRSKLRAAQSELEQARLELTRTKVAAPFDAQILERYTELGAQVSAGDQLARLVGTTEYWVIASVPLTALRWIQFPKDGAPGARATIRHRSVWPGDQHRVGTVQRLIGEVDQSTRLGRVLVSVSNPMGSATEPQMILGTLVQLEIEARPLEDVVRLPRGLLRQNDTVWVMEEGELKIRHVEVAFSDGKHAYIRGGLAAGEQVVTTNLATVVDGLPIRTAAGDGESR